MRVVRSINNNIAVCIDSVGNELIAMGKGIGYGELPREVSLEDVTQTFYNVSRGAFWNQGHSRRRDGFLG